MSTQTVEMTNVDYEAQREARGTKQNLARLVKPAHIVDLANGDKSARFRLAINNEFYTASAYIKAGKDALEQFYAGLEKGQLVSVEYKENIVDGVTYLDVWSMFKREVKKNK